MIGYGDQILDFVEKSEFGQFAEETPDLNVAKDMFRKEFSRKVLPMLPWELIDDIMEKVKLDVVKANLDKANNNEGSEY
jgi:hypothetical protein